MTTRTEPCRCVDFEREDPDDSLCFVCTCGHTTEEHEGGFIRPCKFNAEAE